MAANLSHWNGKCADGCILPGLNRMAAYCLGYADVSDLERLCLRGYGWEQPATELASAGMAANCPSWTGETKAAN